MASEMCLRSSVPKEIKEKKPSKNLKAQPYIEYKGKVYYFSTFIDCAMHCDNLLSKANSSDLFYLGFDMEWPFSFQTGSGKTALIQISPSLYECFLFHVFDFRNLPKALTELLSHPNVRLTGVNIKNDIHKLGRDFNGFDTSKALENCIDLRTDARNLAVLGSYGMESLVNHFLNMQMNKSKKVRCSKWNVIPLTGEQQVYAATDAYVSLKLYLHLNELMKKKQLIEI